MKQGTSKEESASARLTRKKDERGASPDDRLYDVARMVAARSSNSASVATSDRAMHTQRNGPTTSGDIAVHGPSNPIPDAEAIQNQQRGGTRESSSTASSSSSRDDIKISEEPERVEYPVTLMTNRSHQYEFDNAAAAAVHRVRVSPPLKRYRTLI